VSLLRFLRRQRGSVCRLCVPGCAVLVLIGCAQHNTEGYQSHSSLSLQSQGAVGASRIIRIESDGLPAQHPPQVQRQAAVDDPSEPFSPNYGRRMPISRVQAVPAAVPLTYAWRVNVRPAKANATTALAIVDRELHRHGQTARPQF